MKSRVSCLILVAVLAVNVASAEPVGPPIYAQYFWWPGVTLTPSSPSFTTNLTSYDNFTKDLYAISGSGDPYKYADVGYTDGTYDALGPGVIKVGMASSWPWGFVVYKFVVQAGYVTSGGTISAHVFYQGTPNTYGVNYYLGVSPTFSSTDLAYFNYDDFTKADCSGTEGWGQYFRTLSLNIPANLGEFYVVLGKNPGGGYDSISTDQISVNATLSPAIRGTVVLDGYAPVDPTVPVAVKAELRDPATQALVASASSILDSQGRFTFSDAVAPGTYAMSVQGCGWLKKTVTVTVAAGFNDLPAVHLSGGDLDGSNEVTSADLALLLSNMDLVGN